MGGLTASTGGSRSRSTRGFAHDTDATILQAIELWKIVDRPNLLIKIPATKAGLPAITAVIAEGISVNVTLIFSVERHVEVMDAYLPDWRRPRRPVTTSRQSTRRVVLRLPRRHRDRQTTGGDRHPGGAGDARQGRGGQCPIGLCRLRRGLHGPAVCRSVPAGARVQRPLWARPG